MGRQSRLVLLLLLTIGVYQITLASTPNSLHLIHDDIPDSQLDSAEQDLQPLKDIKISTPKESIKVLPSSTPAPQVKSTKTETTKAAPSSTVKVTPVKNDFDMLDSYDDEDGEEADAHFSKLLAEAKKLEKEGKDKKDGDKKESDKNDDEYEYDYNYDDDYNYNDNSSTEVLDSKDTKNAVKPEAADKTKKEEKTKKIEMKPILDSGKKETSKTTSKAVKDDKKATNLDDDIYYNLDDDEDEEDDDDDDDDDDNDIADEEEIVFSENVPCPRFCTCARNINSYLVATCSRLDPGLQKFGLDITDLVVTDVGPKYPIFLGPDFFLQLGLKHVSSIKISNCTIDDMHVDAFNGLDELYSVNLTNVGLSLIKPDTFAKSKKLRLLTISGNDLSVMSSVHYLLKSSTIEELDLSRNNLMELNPSAFSKLSNIVYINLANNNLKEIPAHVFDSVETIEELVLSHNQLKELPADIFNRTALAILNLAYNEFTGDLHFGNSDLQQLDLAYNSIESIHHGMFDKMTGLTNLNLKGNGIKKIQPDSFLTLKNLRHIDLSLNDLNQISSLLFFKNSELDVIRLNDNPRLSQLPTDGFRSYNGYFTAYFLDISSCAISSLGYKTFSTMPHLATLKLAWNNINNLEPKTFATLTKLNDLDLSNNLIHKLDDLLFINNNDLTKLNLAGNPLNKLSVRLFSQMKKLRELDVSDCELKSLLVDKPYGVGRKYAFYDTLRSFNASANQIENISTADIKKFKSLRFLDIARNPLQCNDKFIDFITHVQTTQILPRKVPTLAELKSDDASSLETNTVQYWSKFEMSVCQHHNSPKFEEKAKEIEQHLKESDQKLKEDKKSLQNIMEHKKYLSILKDAQKNENEEKHNNGGEIIDDQEEDAAAAEDESDYDEDDEADNDEGADNADADGDNGEDDEDDDEEDDETDYDKAEKSKIKDHGVKIEEVELSKETRDKFLLDKFHMDNDNEDGSFEEEIIIDRGRIYYSGYRFLIPIALVLMCVVVILLAIAKIISVVVHKRGERYRMALLAQKNSSIVYQKLTEDIKPPKEPKQPKVHRYAPLNQV